MISVRVVLEALGAPEGGGLRDLQRRGRAATPCCRLRKPREKGVVWKCALEVLDEIRRLELKLDVISVNAKMSACEKAVVWKRALGLLDEMRGCVTR